MQISETSPETYLASLEEPAAQEMAALDRMISEALPGRSRVLWEGVFWGGTQQQIIGYGELMQPRPRGEDVRWFVVGLARQKAHTSVYVNATKDGRYLVQSWAERLGRVKVSSARVAIRSLDRLDQDAFTQMITEAGRLCPPDPQ